MVAKKGQGLYQLLLSGLTHRGICSPAASRSGRGGLHRRRTSHLRWGSTHWWRTAVMRSWRGSDLAIGAGGRPTSLGRSPVRRTLLVWRWLKVLIGLELSWGRVLNRLSWGLHRGGWLAVATPQRRLRVVVGHGLVSVHRLGVGWCGARRGRVRRRCAAERGSMSRHESTSSRIEGLRANPHPKGALLRLRRFSEGVGRRLHLRCRIG